MLMEAREQTGSYPHTPDYVIPIAPGEHLKEKLDEMGMTTEQFSEASGLPVEAVELFFVGKLPVTPSLAEKMEAITRMPARLWMNFERGYHENLKRAAKKYGLYADD